jgi:hypothetical protein
MELNFQLDVNVKTESDVQALISLYVGLSALKKNSPIQSGLLPGMCEKIEAELKPLHTAEEWENLQNELGIYTDKAVQFANDSQDKFNEFSIT